jgi:pyruvate kinase
MFTRTKIICTIGPSVDTVDKMVELIHGGMNVARLNFSHGNHKSHGQTIENLKKAREMTQVPMGIMLDTKGPEIRIHRIKNGSVSVSKDQELNIEKEFSDQENCITINPFSVMSTVKVGTTVLFDDGYIESEVIEQSVDKLVVRMKNSGVLKENKGINIPDVILNLPAMTEQDIKDITFACKMDVDFIAASFIRSAEHVLSVKELLLQEGKPDVRVIAKIENPEGVENFDSIVQVADGIMIGRGDLGVEVDLAKVPNLQKMMIRKCYHACKPVVTATQMLESMIVNPRPTRAEVSDVANAVFDSSSCVMLSGETAVGNYAIETVLQMKNILEEAEKEFNFKDFFYLNSRKDYHDISSAVALSAVKTGYSANAKAIFAFTSSGSTARLVSRLRPEIPIIAMTQDRKTYNQLAFNWGVIPFYVKKCSNVQEAIELTSKFALERKIVEFGDLIVVTAGSPFGKKGSTNMMTVEHIGDVLVKGVKGIGAKTQGKVKIVLSSERHEPSSVDQHILLIPRCDQTFMPLVKNASAVIMQNHLEDSASEKYLYLLGKTFDIPVIVRVDGALSLIKNDDIISLDPKKGLVFRGS